MTSEQSKELAFTPVTITLETKEELATLYTITNHISSNSIRDINKIFEEITADEFKGIMYNLFKELGKYK